MRRKPRKNSLRKAALFLAAALLVICTPAFACATGSSFTDVTASHPAYLYVQACGREGIMNGRGDGSFGPDEPLTAEQLSVMIIRACFPGEPISTEDGQLWSRPYTDAAERLGLLRGIGFSIPEGKPSASEESSASGKPSASGDAGRISGSAYEDGYGGDALREPLRRCDAALIASRAALLLGRGRVPVIRSPEASQVSYSMSRCAQSIGYCLSSGLMVCSEDGLFHGDEILSRAQGAELICRLAGLDLRAADLSSYEPPDKENTSLLVLMYHRVLADGEPCGDWDANESSFRADLAWLAENGFKTVLPSELASGKLLPERAVMLTFDDGYEDNYTRAYPLLVEYGAKAVVAPIVSHLDEEAEGFLNWDMLREMCASGLVEPGSHTYLLHDEGDGGNRGISRGSDSREEYEKRLREDLELSASRIEEETGITPCYFAYPFGLTDSWANGIVDELFPVSSVTRVGIADISKGTRRITRYNANSEYGAEHYARRRYL